MMPLGNLVMALGSAILAIGSNAQHNRVFTALWAVLSGIYVVIALFWAVFP